LENTALLVLAEANQLIIFIVAEAAQFQSGKQTNLFRNSYEGGGVHFVSPTLNWALKNVDHGIRATLGKLAVDSMLVRQSL